MVKNIVGNQYGKLLVISRADNDKHGNAMWLCKCDCGNEKIINGSSLRRGTTLSCGCYNKQRIVENQTTHGKSKTRLFHIWQSIKSRCYNSNNTAYKYYGGRGIIVCDDWKSSFENFQKWSLNNGYNDILTIDRINSNGDYSPTNCRWVDRKIQQRNRRNTLNYTINGFTHDLATWCEIYNVPYERIRHRVVNRGWDIESALSTPKLNKIGNPIT